MCIYKNKWTLATFKWYFFYLTAQYCIFILQLYVCFLSVTHITKRSRIVIYLNLPECNRNCFYFVELKKKINLAQTQSLRHLTNHKLCTYEQFITESFHPRADKCWNVGFQIQRGDWEESQYCWCRCKKKLMVLDWFLCYKTLDIMGDMWLSLTSMWLKEQCVTHCAGRLHVNKADTQHIWYC